MNNFEKWELANSCIPTTELPAHLEMGTDCCGFFSDLRPSGLFCNECSMDIRTAIQGLYNAAKAMAITIGEETDTDEGISGERKILEGYLRRYCRAGGRK